MPRFYFHLRTPNGTEPDEIGLDLDGVEDAYLDAYASIPSMMPDMLRQKASPYQYAFEIMDASGNLLMEVPFAEVLDRARKPPPQQRARWRNAQAEVERTMRLIAGVQEEQQALQATLSETMRLLAATRRDGPSLK